VTTNPPDDAISAEGEEAVDEGAESVAGVTQSDTSSDSTVAEFAERIASLVGSDTWSADFGNAKVQVTPASWVESVDKVRSEAGLEFFSFLSAIDWSNEVEVGDPLESRVSERFEVLVRLSSVENNDAVTLSTDVSKEDPRLASLVDVFGGANWHEREAAEMFGIEFEGHPNLTKLYLPDAFEGFPLRKSFPLLSREVKPWPGLVDVEDQPSTENPEAGADQENAESEEGE
jgi:NADH-quinone oxidoreductase subunit C